MQCQTILTFDCPPPFIVFKIHHFGGSRQEGYIRYEGWVETPELLNLGEVQNSASKDGILAAYCLRVLSLVHHSNAIGNVKSEL